MRSIPSSDSEGKLVIKNGEFGLKVAQNTRVLLYYIREYTSQRLLFSHKFSRLLFGDCSPLRPMLVYKRSIFLSILKETLWDNIQGGDYSGWLLLRRNKVMLIRRNIAIGLRSEYKMSISWFCYN